MHVSSCPADDRLLVPVSAAIIYLACLSTLLTEESGEPGTLVVAFLGFSLPAGLVIKRYSALVLPLGVVAVSLLWVSHIDEDPVAAMIVGLLGGILLAQGYERLQRFESFEVAAESRSHSLPVVVRGARRIVTRKHGLSRRTAGLPAPAALGTTIAPRRRATFRVKPS